MSNSGGAAGEHHHQTQPPSPQSSLARTITKAAQQASARSSTNSTPTSSMQPLSRSAGRQEPDGTPGASWGDRQEAAEPALGGRAASGGRSGVSQDQAGQDGDNESRVGKRTRVEGRGSSAAQRAAASEACKGITLESLQAQYYRPLSDVAKDLRVSVARLLKKCREFGILRWPYRHVRSVQESIEQLEKDREAATDEMATDEMELRLRLLRRRGELVVHFASCGLEAEMRKGIFLADPRDVDAMLANAHEVNGGRKIAAPGWDSLGRFPEVAVREHFLEQMRAHMVGGGAALSPPDSPSAAAQAQDEPPSSHDESRDISHQPQQPAYRMMQQEAHAQGQWQQQHPHQHQQPPWPAAPMFARGPQEQVHPGHMASYWPGKRGATGVPEPASGVGAMGGVSRGMLSSDFDRMRSPVRTDYPAGATAPHGTYPPTSVASWSMGQPPVPVNSGHHEDAGGHQTRNTSSPALRPILSGPPGSSYHAPRPSGVDMRSGDQREGQIPPGAWGRGPSGPGGEPVEDRVGVGSGGHRDMLRPPGRLTPPPAHIGAPARRPWGGDLADPSERSGAPPSGSGGSLPSIFERHGGLDRPASNFLAGPGGVAVGSVGVDGAQPVGVDGGGADPGSAPRESAGWAGTFHEPPLGSYRWNGPTHHHHPHHQQQLQQSMGYPVSAPRWQNGPPAASSGPGVSTETETSGNGSRGDSAWAIGARGGIAGEGFDRHYAEALGPGHGQGGMGVDMGEKGTVPDARRSGGAEC